jgi:ABC-2 type transport system ATP-binding protein
VDGKLYPQLSSPMHEVGALLDAKAAHGGRTAYQHLLCLAVLVAGAVLFRRRDA